MTFQIIQNDSSLAATAPMVGPACTGKAASPLRPLPSSFQSSSSAQGLPRVISAIFRDEMEKFAPQEKNIDLFYKKILNRQKLIKSELFVFTEFKEAGVFVLINNTQFYLLKKIGEGTQSNVYKSSGFSAEGTESGLVLKISKSKPQRYTPQKKIVDLFCDKGKGRLDVLYKTLQLKDGYSCAVCKEYNGDLHSINFLQFDKPAEVLISGARKLFQGVAYLHAKKFIHRDLKGGNTLWAAKENGGVKVAITDFGLVQNEPEGPHKSCFTHPYLMPQAFGPDAEESLVNQRKRMAIQGQAADRYAYGVTVISDLFVRCFLQLDPQVGATLRCFTPAFKVGPFTDEELREIGKNHPFHAIYYEPNKRRPKERVLLIAPLEERRQAIEKAIEICSPHFSVREIELLQKISQFAFALIEGLEAEKPTSAIEFPQTNQGIKRSLFLDQQNSPPNKKAKRSLAFDPQDRL